MADDPKHLLSGYAAEILSDDERRRLMEAALGDQEIFDQLVEEESWRRLLNTPGVRRELLAALQEPGRRRGFLQWLRQPVLQWAMGAAAAVVLAVVLIPYWRAVEDVGPADTQPTQPTAAAPDTRGLTPATEDELVAKSYRPDVVAPKSPAQKSPERALLHLSYSLELRQEDGFRRLAGDDRFRPGDRFRIRLETDFEAWVYLVNRAADEDVYAVVYPRSDEEREPVEGELILPPGKNEWLSMDDTPGDEHLVLVVATAAWPALPPGRSTVAYEELEAALRRAERELEAVSWRRVVEDDQFRLTVAEPPDDLVVVARLLPVEP